MNKKKQAINIEIICKIQFNQDFTIKKKANAQNIVIYKKITEIRNYLENLNDFIYNNINVKINFLS